MTPPIKVTTNELTCLNCGEVFPASWSGCPRCSNMSDVTGSGYGRNFDGTRGDVLDRLEMVLRSTPPHALAATPLKRALLEATVAELRRLRGEVSAMRAIIEGRK